jgi:hypothetical protein
MKGMSYGRIVLGGLLAGLIINLSEFVLNGVVLMDRMEAAMAGMGLEYAAWAMPAYMVMAFLWGIGLVALYAAIRPRFGPGPRTALGAGLAFWVFVSLLPSIAFAAMGFGDGLIAISLVWTVVEMPVAAVAGAWVYREAEEVARVPAL